MRRLSFPSVVRRIAGLACMTVATLGMATAMPRVAMADERSWYNIAVDINNGVLFLSRYYDSPESSFVFVQDDLADVLASFGSYEASQIMASDGVLGTHPADGSQEELTVTLADASPNQIHLKWRTRVNGTVNVTDDGNGTGTVAGDMGERGDSSGHNTFHDTIQLSATPNDGYEFDRWVNLSGDGEFLSDEDMTNPNAQLRVTRPNATPSEPLSVSIKATFRETTQDDSENADTGTDSGSSDDDGTTEDSDSSSSNIPATDGEGETTKSQDGRMLPATGDAMVVTAMGTIALSGVAFAYARHKRM